MKGPRFAGTQEKARNFQQSVELRIEIAHAPLILEKMWRTGFRVLAFGIESAQDKTLKWIGKGFNSAGKRGL